MTTLYHTNIGIVLYYNSFFYHKNIFPTNNIKNIKKISYFKKYIKYDKLNFTILKNAEYSEEFNWVSNIIAPKAIQYYNKFSVDFTETCNFENMIKHNFLSIKVELFVNKVIIRYDKKDTAIVYHLTSCYTSSSDNESITTINGVKQDVFSYTFLDNVYKNNEIIIKSDFNFTLIYIYLSLNGNEIT